MKAIIITEEAEPLKLAEVPKPQIKDGECLVKVFAAALNRRDQWIREGMYPGIRPGCILGSDACGVVEQGSSEWIGKEVIINPNVNWGSNPEVQSTDYSVLGMPKDGTMAEYMVVDADRLHEKPIHLNHVESASLPLSGLTAYRALIKKGQADPGKNILITGAGGGVSQLAIAFSVASGANTYVTSSSNDKIARCISEGVKGGFNYKDDQWFEEASIVGGFDVIIDSAGGEHLNNYLKVVKPAGKIIIYGSTAGYPQKLDIFRLFWSQVQIIGSTMGNDTEFEEMIEFVNTHQIRPTLDKVFKKSEFLDAFDRFKEPDHFGKIVLKLD